MKNTKKCFYLFFFWSCLVDCRILVPQPETEAMPLAVKVKIHPNPWIAKEFLKKCLKILNNFYSMTRPWF